MKRVKILLVMVLSLVLCLALVACNAPADKDVTNSNAGTNSTNGEGTQIEGNKLTNETVVDTGWQCTYHTADGDKIYTRFILAADGTYNQIIAINELYDHSEKGTYEVKGGALYLYLNGDTTASIVYEYKNGNLVNSGNEYTPYEG